VFNPYIIVPLATWVIAQLTKFTIEAFKGKLDFRNLYATGGMPSVHSAVVASLATTSALLDGANSHLFGLTLVFAVIVIYDSLNVRRSTGDQAVALNLVIDSLNTGRGAQPLTRLREVLGHTPAEVTVGTVMGVVLGGLFNYNHLNWLGNFLTATPSRPELFTYLGISLALLIVSIVLRVVFRRPARLLASWGKLLRNLLAIGIGAAVLEGIFTFGALENASFLTWRAWSLLTVVVALTLVIWTVVKNSRRLPAEALAAAEIERKEKWLKPAKKRHKR
jgi:acid phosphatase family membrane protein YuiD